MWKKFAKGIGIGLACLCLTSCSHPQLMDFGVQTDTVEVELGAPHARVTFSTGGERWVYSMQPFGQEVWWLTFDDAHRLVQREEVLNREHMALIKPGVSTQADVWNLFGPCAQKYTFALIDQIAWMYRFRDEGIFDMACWVQFDQQGIVTEVGFTTDPWKDRDNSLFLNL